MNAEGDRALGGAGTTAQWGSPTGAPSGAAPGGSLATARSAVVTASTFEGNQAISGEAILFFFSMAGIPVGTPAGDARGGAVFASGTPA